METHFFRINKKEYCHISKEQVFIISGTEVKRIPEEHELGDAWSVSSILNYIFFLFMLVYVGFTVTVYGELFFSHIYNYGVLLLLLMSFVRVKSGFETSSTATISRHRIKTVHLKTPMFSFPRLDIYFNGHEGKVLKKTIPVLYTQEAIPVLKSTGLMA